MFRNPAWLYKTFVVGVIVLFIGVGIQPVFANDTNIRKKNDDYQEIITFVLGYGRMDWITRRGIFRGEVVTYQERIVFLSLKGLRLANNGIEKYNITDVNYLYAPHFIGFSRMITIFPEDPPYYGTIGVAFGNIEWGIIEW
jgi:hypothetical protein